MILDARVSRIVGWTFWTLCIGFSFLFIIIISVVGFVGTDGRTDWLPTLAVYFAWRGHKGIFGEFTYFVDYFFGPRLGVCVFVGVFIHSFLGDSVCPLLIAVGL